MLDAPCAPWNFENTQKVRAALNEHLPPIVTRKTAAEMTGNFITPKTLANLDSLHRGPGQKICIGRQVGYLKQDFIDFICRQMR